MQCFTFRGLNSAPSGGCTSAEIGRCTMCGYRLRSISFRYTTSSRTSSLCAGRDRSRAVTELFVCSCTGWTACSELTLLLSRGCAPGRVGEGTTSSVSSCTTYITLVQKAHSFHSKQKVHIYMHTYPSTPSVVHFINVHLFIGLFRHSRPESRDCLGRSLVKTLAAETMTQNTTTRSDTLL